MLQRRIEKIKSKAVGNLQQAGMNTISVLSKSTNIIDCKVDSWLFPRVTHRKPHLISFAHLISLPLPPFLLFFLPFAPDSGCPSPYSNPVVACGGFRFMMVFCPKTPKSATNQNSRNIPNFIMSNIEKQMVPCKSTAEEVSFEWSHHRISSTDSEVRTTLHVSIINTESETV